jgi:hypothetical protein
LPASSSFFRSARPMPLDQIAIQYQLRTALVQVCADGNVGSPHEPTSMGESVGSSIDS